MVLCFLISPNSAGASNQKPLPLPGKPLLLSASKTDAHPHLQEDKLNTITQVATKQLQAGAPALSGIPAHKHLRQQQQGEVESVAV